MNRHFMAFPIERATIDRFCYGCQIPDSPTTLGFEWALWIFSLKILTLLKRYSHS